MNSRIAHGCDIDRTDTWIRFRKEMCDDCRATCCTMPTEVRVADLVRLGVLDEFEAGEEPRLLARQLQKRGLIEHFNHRYALFTLARRASGDCVFLDPQSRRCTVYEKRPDTCRQHPKIGPRPGFCAFQRKQAAKPADEMDFG